MSIVKTKSWAIKLLLVIKVTLIGNYSTTVTSNTHYTASPLIMEKTTWNIHYLGIQSPLIVSISNIMDVGYIESKLQ